MRVNNSCLCLLACLFTVTTVRADVVDDADRLLRLSNAGTRFEATAMRQTRDILRTYSSIVSRSGEPALPDYIQDNIAACYAEVYAWEKFESGIARILADNLTHKQILLLIDFYQGLGLPPAEIQTFKDTIAKAPVIQRLSTDYIFTHTASCVDRDAVLIINFLGSQTAPSQR